MFFFQKRSGFIPARADDWSFDLFEPYIKVNHWKAFYFIDIITKFEFKLKHTLECFGTDRCMYGADWPVFNFGKDCSILDAFGIVNRIVLEHYGSDQKIWDNIFYNNAIKIYKISM